MLESNTCGMAAFWFSFMSLDLFTPQIWFRSFSLDFMMRWVHFPWMDMPLMIWQGLIMNKLDMKTPQIMFCGFFLILWMKLLWPWKKRRFDRWVGFQDHDVEIIGWWVDSDQANDAWGEKCKVEMHNLHKLSKLSRQNVNIQITLSEFKKTKT